jgi:hypothetical protein
MRMLPRFGKLTGGALLLAATLLGCNKEQEFTPAMALGTEYYPLAINTQRTYAVVDTAWSYGVATVTSFQLRESIVDTFRNASGQKSYRVIRSRRVSATDAWANDSVYVLTTTQQTVTLLRDNRRTVELVFPVRESQAWNQFAYDGSSPDTITDVNRRYYHVGQALTIAPLGLPSKTYPETLTTLNEGRNSALFADDLYYLKQYQQVYAKEFGPVMRRWRSYYYCDDNDPTCVGSSDYIFRGNSRYQLLIDYGPL